MTGIIARILCFALVPSGILLLIKTIKFFRPTFSGKVILEIPFATKTARFTIHKKGIYALWQKGQLFKRTPIDKFKPVIYEEATNEIVQGSSSLFRPNINNGTTGRMELKTFSLNPGNYRIELQEGSGITQLEKIISSLLPAKAMDTSKYFIQIRESQPAYFMFLAIFLFILSGWMIIGGFVAGLLIDQIFPALFR